MIKLEREVEKKLRETVEAHGGRCLKWVCPGWSGVPDRILLLPGGRIFFIETKRPKGGKPSAMQLKWKKWLNELGFTVLYVYDYEQIRVLELWLLDKKGY